MDKSKKKTKTDSSQARRFQVTINNPAEKGFMDDVIIEQLEKFKTLSYYVFGHEVAPTTGTDHVHIYFCVKTPTRFSTVRKRFNGAHVEVCRGTSEENRAYILKECGEDGDFTEWGTMPQDGKQAGYMNSLLEMIQANKTDIQIYEANPEYIRLASQIGRVREAAHQESAKTTIRSVSVVYVQAVEPVATRYVMSEYGIEEVYRANGEHLFDFYAGQRVLYLPGFKSTIPLGELLGYIGGYPVQLSARYSNKWAAFEVVVIASTKVLEEQYTSEQYDDHASWVAFLQTVTSVITFDESGQPITRTVEEYMNRLTSGEADSPFNTIVANQQKGATYENT